MLIPQETLDEILDRLDIVSVISEYVQLKKSGKDYKGLCPFHQEKSPSFMVSPSKRIFHCFGCAEGGNLFRFLMKMENSTFPEVAEKLAQKAGVVLKREESADPSKRHREVLFKINRYAAWYFVENLKGAHGGEARRYLERRDLSEESVSHFKLGYAPAAWDGLSSFLASKHVPMEAAEALGLVRKRKDGSYYDFFRHRLMFPIMDAEGRVLAFGGRRLNDEAQKEEPKYINSPESPVYHKGRVVYGMHQAKKGTRQRNEVLIVEGNVDVIRLHQVGVDHAVAPLGTALTADQIRMLSRHAEKFVVMFDGDEAGFRAFKRSLPLFFEAGFHPRVAMLPKGEDPDTFARKKGGPAVEEGLARAPSALDFLMVHELSKAGLSTSHKTETARGLLPLLEKLPSEMERKAYTARLAHFLGTEENVPHGNYPRARNFFQRKEEGVNTAKISLERILIGLYVTYPHLVDAAVEETFVLNLEDAQVKDLFILATNLYRTKGSLSWEQLSAQVADDKGRFIASLAFEPILQIGEEDAVQVVRDCLEKLKVKKLKDALKTLTGEIHLAEMKNDPALLKGLLTKKGEVLKKLG